METTHSFSALKAPGKDASARSTRFLAYMRACGRLFNMLALRLQKKRKKQRTWEYTCRHHRSQLEPCWEVILDVRHPVKVSTGDPIILYGCSFGFSSWALPPFF
jgi:hypothetical protein